MNLPRYLAKLSPLLLAGCIGSAATSWSPISCSCGAVWEDITSGIGRDDIRNPDKLTAQVLAIGLRDTFRGKIVSVETLKAAGSYHCEAMRHVNNTFRCAWWIWNDGNRIKGYDGFLYTDHQGIFERVSIYSVQSVTTE
jgi:hypothetical protein